MRLRFVCFAALMSGPLSAIADGAELYDTYCSRCHDQNSEVLAEFSGSPERFREILEGDTEEMPDFYGMFEPDEVAELYEYVMSVADQP